MPTLLVVDDVPIDRMLVSGILQRNPELKVETAEGGNQALSRLEQPDPIDVVITDLTMPDMDGLQLVTAIRVRFPHVPVILTTANGSEHLAIAALEQGAANYVPKLQLADKLLDTVDQVLSHVRSQTMARRLMRSLTYAELRFLLDADEQLFDQLVDLVQQLLAGIRSCDGGEQVRLGMALSGAIRDLVLRGNLELNAEQVSQYELHRAETLQLVERRLKESPYCERQVAVDVRLAPEETRFSIRHQGPTNLRELTSLEKPSLNECESRAHVLMQAFLDEVQVHDDGKGLTLVKRA